MIKVIAAVLTTTSGSDRKPVALDLFSQLYETGMNLPDVPDVPNHPVITELEERIIGLSLIDNVKSS